MKFKITLLLSLIPTYFFGWGAEGHRIVANVAQKHLNKGVEERVQKYLGETSFEKAATWMDEIRSDHDYDYMKPWHYVNIEKGDTYKKAKNGDIVSELELVIGVLRRNKELEQKDIEQGLKMLFHLCGDLVQPLHVGYGIDKGGNDVKLNFKGENSSLHHIWDSDLIETTQINSALCIEKAKQLTNSPLVKSINIEAWMKDSRSYLPQVYQIKGSNIDQDYIDSSKEIIESQLAKGGLILATILNDIFKD